MFVADVLVQLGWSAVPHVTTSNVETAVTETAIGTRNDAFCSESVTIPVFFNLFIGMEPFGAFRLLAEPT